MEVEVSSVHMSTRAAAIARAAHRGQVDKAGRPYVEHPARVAARLAGDDVAVSVAWLHDVVEDSEVSLLGLAEEFPVEVVRAVDALTRRAGESSERYYARVRSDALALRVKLADVADNSDPVRLAELDTEVRERLTRKYEHARLVLMEGV
mgnify:CR=1 FL=1